MQDDKGRNGHLLYPRLAPQLCTLIGCPWMLACTRVLAQVKARSKPPDFFALPFPFDFTSSTTIIATTRTYSHSAPADRTAFIRKSTSYHTPLTISLPPYRITALPHYPHQQLIEALFRPKTAQTDHSPKYVFGAHIVFKQSCVPECALRLSIWLLFWIVCLMFG